MPHLKTNSTLILSLYFFTFAFLILCLLPSFPAEYWWIDDVALSEWILPKLEQGLRGIISYFALWGFHYDYYPVRDLSIHSDFWMAKALGWPTPLVHRIHQFVLFLEVSLGLFFLQVVVLRKAKKQIRPLVLACSLSLWAVLPIHLEALTWISARKDLLAMAFSVWACVFFFSNQVLLFVVLFGLGLFGKSSFSLLPISLFLFSKSFGFQLSLQQKKGLVATFLFGFLSSILQTFQYSKVNDMRFLIPWWERLQLAITAFGKSISALFYSGANVLEVENWGGWGAFNRVYFVIGSTLLFGLLIYSVYLMAQRKWRPLYILLGMFLLILPSVALLFPSRNFFSVRFYEPVFLTFPLVAYLLADRFSIFRKIIFALLPLCFIHFYVQSLSFGDGLEVSRKSYEYNPQNPSLAFSFYNNLVNEERWGASTDEEIQTRKNLHLQLRSECLAKSPVADPLCYSFWRASFFAASGESRIALRDAILSFRSLRSYKNKEELSLENEILYGSSLDSSVALSEDVNYCNQYEFLCSDNIRRKALLQTLCRQSQQELAKKYFDLWREKLIMVSQGKDKICQTDVSE